jgi:hypothetical protein
LTAEERQFERVLEELAILMGDLGGLSDVVTIIGGQVLAIESRLRGGTGEVLLETETGQIIPRGFTLEPDLLFDLDGSEFMAERLVEVLRARGYKRVKTYRWSKDLEEGRIDLDLFVPEGVPQEDLPTGMTPLKDARLVVRGRRPFHLRIGKTTLSLARPSIVGFIAMKVRAKRELRPEQTKDSFDLAAYVSLIGPKAVLDALSEGREGRRLQASLVDLFGSISAPGVRDVVAYAGSLEPEEQQLLARSVVDMFSDFLV